MIRSYAGIIGAVAGIAGIWAGSAAAQQPANPPVLAPVVASPAAVPPGADGPYLLDALKVASPEEDPGFFFDLGVELLKPHLKATLTTPGPLLPGATDAPVFPVGTMDWTGAPQIVLGYRLPAGMGDVRVDYRLVSSSGTETIPGFDAAGASSLRTRLNLNQVDIDYRTAEFLTGGEEISPWFRRDLRAGFGIRVVSAFFDASATGQQLAEKASSIFAGVGPHGFLEYHQAVGDLPVALYTRISAAGVFGSIRQRFTQSLQTDGVLATAAFDTGHLSTGIGTIQGEAGVSWVVPIEQLPLRLSLGYTWERWWNFADTDDSRGELTLQGLFFRGEFRY
jgi:hypothetical protein